MAIVALFQPPRWVSILLLLGALALTIWSATIAYRQQRHEAAERAEAWEATLETALPAGLRRVRQTNPYEATLVAPASRARRYPPPAGESRPPYVEREADPDIEKALADPDVRALLVQGPPHAGKGRSTFEAVARAMPDHWLVVPGGFEGLQVVRSLRPPCPPGEPVLLWLDELRDFVRLGGLPSAWVDRWVRTPDLKLVALATDRDLAALARDGEIHQPLRDALAQFGGLQNAVGLAGRHSDREWDQIRRLYPQEEVRESLGEYFVTSERHLEWLQAAERTCPEAFLVVWSCAVAQHELGTSWVEAEAVRVVFHLCRRLRPSTERLTMEQFDAGVEHATAEPRESGRSAPLRQRTDERPDGEKTLYSTPRYLVEHVVEELSPS